jgi:glycogen debranching enzyme
MKIHPDNLKKSARQVLDANWTGQFTKPAPSLYPHQWNWDAGFIALGYATYRPERAIQELQHLFAGQWSNGMLPQIIFGEEKGARYFPGYDFWQTAGAPHAPNKPTSGITMPPVHGFVLWELFQKAEDPEQLRPFLKEIFPKVVKLHRYLYTYRDPKGEGLPYIQHPWESGTDNSPTWDPVLNRIDTQQADIPPYQRKDLQNPEAAKHRPTDQDYDRYVYLVDLFRKHRYEDARITAECPFLVQDPLFLGILAWSNECLIQLGEELGLDTEDLVHWNELTVYSMNEKLWDEDRGVYQAYDLAADETLACHTSSCLMPLVSPAPNQEQAERILQNMESPSFQGYPKEDYFWCPTYELSRPDLNFEKYWRGPIWINMNWLLYRGLLRYDMTQAAKKMRQDTLELVERYGFYEYFDPRKTNTEIKGYGTHQFSWTAALTLDLLSER